MAYHSTFFGVDARDEIARDFTDPQGHVDDMMAGLHEIRVRRAEKKYDIKKLSEKAEPYKTLRWRSGLNS